MATNEGTYDTIKTRGHELLKGFLPYQKLGNSDCVCCNTPKNPPEHTFLWTQLEAKFSICTEHAASLGLMEVKDSWYVERLRQQDV